MSVGYQAVGWSRQKKLYDIVLATGVGVSLLVFVGVSLARHPEATAETLLIRAFGGVALLLLHVILAIGPLCRLDRRFLPLLYNRRHLGVTMGLCALVHGGLALYQHHALGTLDPVVSVLTSDGTLTQAARFPFQPFGAIALVILFLMAATSHDFWLANLTPPTWKALHLLVYAAYALLLAHVAFGAAQAEGGGAIFWTLAAGATALVVLHLGAARQEQAVDASRLPKPAPPDAFVDVLAVADIPENRARVVFAAGERVAIFKYAGKISAVSSVCQHQNGPLGEGRILDGCITCPWHGYQYRPDCGASPAPFTEKVPTFRTQVRAGRVWLDPRPLPPGTPVEPALVA